jgi:hypothetical protein
MLQKSQKSQFLKLMKHALKEAQQQAPDPNGRPLIVAIIPDSAKELKDKIKFYGDIVLGIPTQCFVREIFLYDVDNVKLIITVYWKVQ